MPLNHQNVEITPGQKITMQPHKTASLHDIGLDKVGPTQPTVIERVSEWKICFPRGDHGLIFAPRPFGPIDPKTKKPGYWIYPDVISNTYDATVGDIPKEQLADPSATLVPDFTSFRKLQQSNGQLPVHMVLGFLPDRLRRNGEAHHEWARQLLDPAFLFAWEDMVKGWWLGADRLIDERKWTPQAVEDALLPNLRKMEEKMQKHSVALQAEQERLAGTKADIVRIAAAITEARKDREKVVEEGKAKLAAWLDKYK